MAISITWFMAAEDLCSIEYQSGQKSILESQLQQDHPYVVLYINLLDKGKWVVMAVWLAAVLGCIYPVILLFPATRLFFEPPKGSETWRANQQLKKYFPQYVSDAVCVVLFQDQRENIISEYTKELVGRINQTLSAKGYDDLIADRFDYYTLMKEDLPHIAQASIGSDNHTMLMLVDSRDTFTTEASHFMDDFLELISTLQLRDGYSVQRSGSMFVFNDFLGHVLHEILSTDVITTVVALLTILLFVGSVPLMVLPIANLIASMVLSMALLYSLTHAWAIATFVPGVVMSLILAITIDYSFFILVRYNREVTEFPEEHYRAVVRTVSFAGQVISISGVTLAISFLGLVFLGVGFMNGIGIGCFLSLLIMILANLTLGPSLLLAFPAFFARRLCWTCKRREMVDSIWYKLASFATSTKGAVILLGGTAVLIAPVIAGCAWFETVHDMSLAFVKSLPSVSALDSIQRHFPPGMIMPIYATAEMGPAQDPFCQEYFDESQELIHRLTDATGGGISNSSVISMSVVDGYFLPFQVAQLMLEVPEYQYLLKRVRSIADDGAAATMILYTTFSPISPLFYDFNTKIRDVMTDFRKTARFDWTLGGLEILVRDLSDRSYARFPVMLSVTLLIVGVFVGVTMRSVLLPIRLVFTIGLTVAWTYGLASLIFCAGILDWISPAINNNQHDMYWLVPLTMTTIVIGLGCDYDIFLFTRITELRAEGKSPDEAICEGYYHTGEVITGAGLVMAIAFSGLASSEMPIVREIGTFLAGSVILDTFVVRMLIVPPILHFLGRFNWWPSRLSLKADYAPLH